MTACNAFYDDIVSLLFSSRVFSEQACLQFLSVRFIWECLFTLAHI